MIFVDKVGKEHHVKVLIGMSMLEAARHNDIDLEGKNFHMSLLILIKEKIIYM